MDFVKKCKRVWGSNNKLYPESRSGSYCKLLEKNHKQKYINKKPSSGCLCVYVGSEKQRFIIRIKIFNHPLFKTLLEDVENEYGYRNDGPLWLPCDVDLFCKVLVEIGSDGDDMGFVGCNFYKHNPVSHSSLSCCSSNLSCNVNYQVLV